MEGDVAGGPVRLLVPLEIFRRSRGLHDRACVQIFRRGRDVVVPLVEAHMVQDSRILHAGYIVGPRPGGAPTREDGNGQCKWADAERDEVDVPTQVARELFPDVRVPFSHEARDDAREVARGDGLGERKIEDSTTLRCKGEFRRQGLDIHAWRPREMDAVRDDGIFQHVEAGADDRSVFVLKPVLALLGEERTQLAHYLQPCCEVCQQSWHPRRPKRGTRLACVRQLPCLAHISELGDVLKVVGAHAVPVLPPAFRADTRDDTDKRRDR